MNESIDETIASLQHLLVVKQLKEDLCLAKQQSKALKSEWPDTYMGKDFNALYKKRIKALKLLLNFYDAGSLDE